MPASKTPVVFADVVSRIKDAPVFHLLHIVPAVVPWFPTGDYELTLVITADGVKAEGADVFSLPRQQEQHRLFQAALSVNNRR